MKTDIEIAQNAPILPIKEIAAKLNLTEADLKPYGHTKAKISLNTIKKLPKRNESKLILVTAINPTPAGEGKSTCTIGLGDALSLLGKRTAIALREPSLGPTMGVKGGAAGGGYSQVIPMEEINLHFTGDMHAITAANNALAALIDNHIFQGNALNIDPRRIKWKRALDLNDRALRHVTIGLGGISHGIPREDGFDITVASEIMAILCLATDLVDLKRRLGRILIAETYDRQPIYVADLGVEGALTLLLKDALEPNLVQTLAHTPAIVHGGPFANIAHGCNSVLATQTALKLADYVVTEAGFGADLGAEKFLDIKVPQLGKAPDCVVIVATVRSLKLHGGVSLADLQTGENYEAVRAGFANLRKHIENMQQYQVPCVVALNAFVTDTPTEQALVAELCEECGVSCVLTTVWEHGGQGGIALAQTVVDTIEGATTTYRPLLGEEPLLKRIHTIVTRLYGGADVKLSPKAQQQLRMITQRQWDHLPVCMAKTQYSLSDDPKKLGAPTQFTLTVRELVPKLGAGFIVALTGDVLTMPGLPKQPAALAMDVDEQGVVTGLF
ncbi:formate--tetrahydrofolate ligase [Aerococcaceae bacterium NML191219]|nr:formate--tetrahydrofolate ligase [Aerococcaceae bacterium NML191219]